MASHLQSHVETLTRSSIFSNLPIETLGRLAIGTSEVAFGRGSVVFGRGSVSTGIHVVDSGQLKLTIETLQGDEHVVEIVQDGDCFGEAAMLTNRLHLLSAVALSDCKLLHVARNTLINELEHNQALAQRLIANLSDRLYRRTSDMENILLRKALGRVARFILDELEREADSANGQIQLPARKGLIASKLNMTQEHFSRTLRTLCARGKIAVNGATIAVVNEEGLRQIAA